MSKTIFGDRIGATGKILVGCSAVVFNGTREKVLLTRRADNGQWCLPSGHMEPGESAVEACIREVKEETGLSVRVKRLVGIYTNPNRLLEYPDGNKFHLVALHFEAEVTGGELSISAETTDFGYFTLLEINAMDMLEIHRERIEDAVTGQIPAFMR
ncbi:MAG: NUDIX domain-containing protein [Anaerolineales bacterium]|nr:NUDIX domain-containing protein [Anaerolineales bacterium]